ncbi:MAG TPA: hypothetical protein VG734_17940 [Lacunisphaera sp.]|nr:hypothetical protein [Lacunisphaera sp.]
MKEPTDDHIGALLSKVDTPEGRRMAQAEILKHGMRVYGRDTAYPDLLVELNANGTRRYGKWIGGRFVPVDPNPS